MTTLDSQRGDRDAAVVVAAGGAGLRLGAGPPKALRLLAGEPLLLHAARRLAAAGSIGQLVVAGPPGYEPAIRALIGRVGPPGGIAERVGPLRGIADGAIVVTGGTQRQDSVATALAAVPPEFQIVLVHDAARALTPPSLIERVVAAVRAGHDAVIPVLPVVDTVIQVDADGRVVATPDRSTLRAVQTPQGFRRSVLEAAHAAAAGAAATDDAGLVARLGVPVHTVDGSPDAMKITTRSDLFLAEALLAADSAG